ncbi:MAG: ribonuclease P protein component [Sedimentisphaerales bacterium]
MMKQFSFPKKKRLINNRQFKAVLADGLRLNNRLLTLYMAENNCGYPRLGISISKSCGSAVVRNRLKRLLREAFRQSQDRIPADFDYLLMISPQWQKKLCRVGFSPPNSLGGASILRSRATAKDESPTLRLLTFEQVKDSFLALVQKSK